MYVGDKLVAQELWYNMDPFGRLHFHEKAGDCTTTDHAERISGRLIFFLCMIETLLIKC